MPRAAVPRQLLEKGKEKEDLEAVVTEFACCLFAVSTRR